MKYPKLYIGPMSKNTVDAAIEVSDVGFCASRRQIEYDGGYVNGWTTRSFVKYIRQNSSDMIIVRDHAGPGQGKKEDDGLASLKRDAKLMDIIHIDPWKKFYYIEKGIAKTAECIEFCNKVNKNCLYEVGTEESIRKLTPDGLYIFLKGLKKRLGDQLFSKILYAVIQSGTLLEEDRNTGEYDKERLINMIDVCKEFSVLSKEHNGDYLSEDIIKGKFDLGLDAINIAPEFGVIETMCILDRVSDDKVFDKIYKLCYNSGKWKKWVGDDFDPLADKKQLVKICCHYVFADRKFKTILKLDMFDGIDDEVKSKIKKRIEGVLI